MAPVDTAAQTLESKIVLSWDDVYRRLKNAPQGKLFGIPRGGAIVAGLTGRAVDTLEEADYVVDDIIDTGRTSGRYINQGKPVWALVDKRREEINAWVEFPWEGREGTLEDTVVRQLTFLGENPLRDGLADTPRRVAKSLQELTGGYQLDPKAILSKVFEVDYDEMVVLRGIEFWSLCEHHMLPFHGTVAVGYLPRGKVVGISKLARLVHCFSRRLQVQERLTQQIAKAIQENLGAEGVGVVIRATHLCMALRGVKTPASMVTSCLLGAIRNEAREEFLRLADNDK